MESLYRGKPPNGASRTRPGDLLRAIHSPCAAGNAWLTILRSKAGAPQHLPQHSAARSPLRQHPTRARHGDWCFSMVRKGSHSSREQGLKYLQIASSVVYLDAVKTTTIEGHECRNLHAFPDPQAECICVTGTVREHREESQLALRGHIRRPSTACGTQRIAGASDALRLGLRGLGGARAVEPSVSRNRT
jgi:hypothetical protein